MHLSEIADPDIAEVTRLASLLTTSSTPSSLSSPQSRLTRDQAHDTVHGSVSITCTCGIACSDTKSRLKSQDDHALDSPRRYSCISDLVGSPSDLRISSVTVGPSTFGFGHRIGSLRIYFGSSLDLSDSSLILEIGPFSEILRISRPFTHPVPLPFPLPPSRIPPFPFLPPPLGCLLIFSLMRPPSYGRPSALLFVDLLDPTPALLRTSSRFSDWLSTIGP